MVEDPIEPQDLSGDLIRFSWVKDGSTTPLWDAGTVQPEDANWMRQVLGISDRTVHDVTAWAEARDALESSGLATAQDLSVLDAQADDLVTRLRAELHPRFIAEHLV